MLTWLLIFLVVTALGIALLLPLYARLLSDLERLSPDDFERLGRPTLFMGSPGRSFDLQRFIYADSREPRMHPRIARTSRVLGLATPLFVALVFGILVWGVSRTWS